jgi:rare lipoprotein A (peptidoglycan hydrolase)
VRMLSGLLPTLILAAAHLPACAGDRSVGMASFYPGLRGELTAAHRSLPFGTHVRVTRIGSGKSVVVRINDRGPFVAGRIIDLSRRAAEYLQMITAGVARVSLQVVNVAAPGEVIRRNPDVHASRGNAVRGVGKTYKKVARQTNLRLVEQKRPRSHRNTAPVKRNGRANFRSERRVKTRAHRPARKAEVVWPARV